MNELTLLAPCAEYEHELVDLLEGALDPERARVTRLHVQTCARCRAWEADYRAIDARLAQAMPRVALSDDFEQRLGKRLSLLARPAQRTDRRLEADREHEHLIEALGRGARRHALLDAIGSVAVTACVLLVARNFLGPGGLLAPLSGGSEAWLSLGGIGAAVALAALTWSARRGVLPITAWRG